MIDVFLGGACNPTTWRQDIAIPKLEAADISYYNPQVEDGRYPMEAEAKAEARGLLFVLPKETRGVATLIEATEAICICRPTWLVIEDIPDGMAIDGHPVTGRELKDLNNARKYLADVAARHSVAVFGNVEDAVDAIVTTWGSLRRISDVGTQL